VKRRALAAALMALPAAGLAHPPGVSYGSYALQGDRLDIALRISAAELAAAWPELAAPPGRLRAGVPAEIVRAIVGTLAAWQSAGTCAPAEAAGLPEAPDGASFTVSYHCPRASEPVQVRVGLAARMPPGHVHVARIDAGGRVEERLLDARSDVLAVEERAAGGSPVARFATLGLQHIFTGWDHVAFVLALLLAGGGLGGALRVVSSFTAGHALTLTLATLGVVSPPPSLVEPLIAASVAYVALENLRDLRRGATRAGRRWPVALAFGLVHGFGFAGALSELGLPRRGLATALVSFNLGVEVGQAALVALVLPLLALLRRRPLFVRAGRPAASTLIGCAGLVWLFQRLPR
jgi:hypothetical protein